MIFSDSCYISVDFFHSFTSMDKDNDVSFVKNENDRYS